MFVSLVYHSLLVWLPVPRLVCLFFLSMLPAPFPLISVCLTLCLSASVSLFDPVCWTLMSFSLSGYLSLFQLLFISSCPFSGLSLSACLYVSLFLFRLVIRSFCLCLSLSANLSVSPSLPISLPICPFVFSVVATGITFFFVHIFR